MRFISVLPILVLAAALPVFSSPTPGQELSNPEFVKRADALNAASVAKRRVKRASGGGHRVKINSSNDFCLLLPKPFGGNIANNEDNAVSFCQNPSGSQRAFPSGFIKAATYKKSPRNYVQVTGCINRSKYGLSKNDQGGQLDYNAPKGAQCAGYPYWVEQIEPANNRFCIRCCMNTNDCPQTMDEDGCTSLMPDGVYKYSNVNCSN